MENPLLSLGAGNGKGHSKHQFLVMKKAAIESDKDREGAFHEFQKTGCARLPQQKA